MKLVMGTRNAAFDDGYRELEAARIIAEAAQKVAQGQFDQKLHDVNGNHVGNLVMNDASLAIEAEEGSIVVQFDTGNAAFEDGPFEFEAARVLTVVADTVRDGGLSFKLRDINGNTIGQVSQGPESAGLSKSLQQAHMPTTSGSRNDSDNSMEY